jgi:xanthine dehydrogenase molybdenum-binding subunit
MAAQKLRDQLFAHAAEVFPRLVAEDLAKCRQRDPDHAVPELDVVAASVPGRFDLVDGRVFLKDAPDADWLRVDLGRLLRAVHFRDGGTMLTAEAFYEPPSELPDWENGRGNLSATYAYGAQGAEVEVDVDTGEVHVLRLVAAHDVGRVLNPQTLKGQIYGALAQGLGYALYEQVVSTEGRIDNASFRDYKIPTVHEMDIPIDLVFIETDDPAGPFGAKGVGEPGLVPTAPAIANAIMDAIGVRITDLPITPEKIVRALAERSAEERAAE